MLSKKKGSESTPALPTPACREARLPRSPGFSDRTFEVGPVSHGKSDLRNHQAIVQPRLYDCLMVTQITLNTEPHGLDSCQGHSYEKFVVPGQAWWMRAYY
jgi:hypothetical protein